jgi:sRNA-binding regulator protein Hfq
MADFRRRRQTPVEKTGAEEYYLIKQMNSRTPMVVILQGGETLRGAIEWYDQHCIKVNRSEGPNLVVYKRSIRYLYKDPEVAPE